MNRTMNRWLGGAVALGAMVVLISPAMADGSDDYVYILGSHLEADNELNANDGFSFQIGVGHELSKMWNIEGYFRDGSTDGRPSLDTSAVGGELQLVFNRDGKFRPYLFGGFAHESSEFTGLEDFNGTAGVRGIGFRADLFDSKRASLRGEYRYSDSDAFFETTGSKFYSLGIQWAFGVDEEPVVVAAAPLDSDGDGVTDDNDRCPNTPAGIAVDSTGCPLDSDGDGVADHLDQCPGTVAGAVVDANGCEMDGDNDGVVDRLDECPNSAPGAKVDTKGCELQAEINLQNVNFETNSDRLLPGAENTLDLIAAALVKYPEIEVEIGGHTDSSGDAAYNESLSERRAQAVADYLAREGVAAGRMSVVGYGEAQPIADNGTPEGRAENRRVVMRITER